MINRLLLFYSFFSSFDLQQQQVLGLAAKRARMIPITVRAIGAHVTFHQAKTITNRANIILHQHDFIIYNSFNTDLII